MDAKIIHQKVQLFIYRYNLDLSEDERQALTREIADYENRLEAARTKRDEEAKERGAYGYNHSRNHKRYMQIVEDYTAFRWRFLEDHGIYE